MENVRLTDRFNIRQQIIGKEIIFLLFFYLFFQGTIYLTSTHLIFIDPEGKRETWVKIIIKRKQDKNKTKFFRFFILLYHLWINYQQHNKDVLYVFEQRIFFPQNLRYQKNVIVLIYIPHLIN